MKKGISCNVFGIILMVLLSWANLLHLLWTVWLTWEQIDTGWGAGTRIEMAALMPLGIQYLSMPVLAAEVVFLVLSAKGETVRGIRIANICLFAAAILQFGLTDLFMFN